MQLNDTDNHIVDAYIELMGFEGAREDIEGEALDAIMVLCDFEHELEDAIIDQLGDCVDFGTGDTVSQRYFDWSGWARDVLLESQWIATEHGIFIFMHI